MLPNHHCPNCGSLAHELDDLRNSRKTHDVIGQAKGILMAQRRITADEAFATLNEMSERGNVKLPDVAGLVALSAEWFDEGV